MSVQYNPNHHNNHDDSTKNQEWPHEPSSMNSMDEEKSQPYAQQQPYPPHVYPPIQPPTPPPPYYQPSNVEPLSQPPPYPQHHSPYPQQLQQPQAHQPQQPIQQVTIVDGNSGRIDTSVKDSNEDISMLLMIGGFLFPILWIINFVMTRSNAVGSKSRLYGNVSCGIWTAMTAIFVAVVCLAVCCIVVWAIVYGVLITHED